MGAVVVAAGWFHLSLFLHGIDLQGNAQVESHSEVVPGLVAPWLLLALSGGSPLVLHQDGPVLYPSACPSSGEYADAPTLGFHSVLY